MVISFREQIAIKTNEQLIEIFMNSDQYQKDYFDLAVSEIERRNIDITGYRQKKQHREEFIKKMEEKGKAGNPTYIAIGMLLAIFGGLIPVIMGYIYSQSKEEVAGQSFYAYDRMTRDWGIAMMVVGLLAMLYYFLPGKEVLFK